LDTRFTSLGFNFGDIDGINQFFFFFGGGGGGQDGYAVIAADGPGEYSVIAEARAGNDGVGVIVTPGTVAYVTTGGWFYLF
jgi:hypothetical protein